MDHNGLVALCLFGVITLSHGSIVDTEYGQVSGHILNVDNGRDGMMPIEVFHGIPFAKDTSGSGRFANPEPRDPWTGVFDATPLGAACPQNPRGLLRLTHPDFDNWSEDCLNLDIYTKDVTGGPYAVMLYFHGGGYWSGANIQYPGHFLATRDVVVVVANYRLNLFGFAYSGNEAAPGNIGLWDQNMAIQFVINNIVNFGGDPNKITIFGESAGAASSSLHIISPFSKDLFQQAIMESGTDFVPFAIDLIPENNVEGMAESLGCLGANDTESIECMRTLDWEYIRDNGTCSECIPVVDGPGGFIPDYPLALREKGDIMKGPIISGINHDECSPYLVVAVPTTLVGCCNRSYYEQIVRNRFVGILLSNADNETQEDTYQALDYNYSPWPHIYDNYKNRDSLERILTDAKFGFGWDKQLKKHQEVAPTFGYVYNYRGRNTSQLVPEWMGVPHIMEIPAVWGYTLFPFNPDVEADSQIEFDLIHWTDEDVRHTIFAQDLWTNFAKYGNPTPQPVPNPLGGTTVWPQFTWDDMNILEIKNTSIDVHKGWTQKDYAFWTEYFPYVVSGAEWTFPEPEEALMNDWSMDGFMSWLIDAKRSGEDLDLDDWEDW